MKRKSINEKFVQEITLFLYILTSFSFLKDSSLVWMIFINSLFPASNSSECSFWSPFLEHKSIGAFNKVFP